MILSDIKQYFSKSPAASLRDLSIHFDVEPEAMRGMLEHWIRKGFLRKLDLKCACSNCCSQCRPDHLEMYEWNRKEAESC